MCNCALVWLSLPAPKTGGTELSLVSGFSRNKLEASKLQLCATCQHGVCYESIRTPTRVSLEAKGNLVEQSEKIVSQDR
jgi:hypothetical protein